MRVSNLAFLWLALSIVLSEPDHVRGKIGCIGLRWRTCTKKIMVSWDCTVISFNIFLSYLRGVHIIIDRTVWKDNENPLHYISTLMALWRKSNLKFRHRISSGRTGGFYQISEIIDAPLSRLDVATVWELRSVAIGPGPSIKKVMVSWDCALILRKISRFYLQGVKIIKNRMVWNDDKYHYTISATMALKLWRK